MSDDQKNKSKSKVPTQPSLAAQSSQPRKVAPTVKIEVPTYMESDTEVQVPPTEAVSPPAGLSPVTDATAKPEKKTIGGDVIAAQIEGVLQKKMVTKGAEVNVAKIGDIISLIRSVIGGQTTKQEADLQEELIKAKLPLAGLKHKNANLQERLQASEQRCKNLLAEVARLQLDRDEIARLKAEQARAQATLEQALNNVHEERKNVGGLAEEFRDVAATIADGDAKVHADRLVDLVGEIKARTRRLDREHQYAQLIEDPEFQKLRDAADGLYESAKQAAGAAGGEAKEKAKAALVTIANDAERYRAALDAVWERQGTVRNVARLEVISATHHDLGRDLKSWREAIS